MERDCLAIMSTIIATERGIEGQCTKTISNCWIVLVKPRHSQHNMMCSGRYVKTDSFFVICNAKDEGVVIVDVTILRGATVGKNQGYRVRFCKRGKLIASRQFIADEITLTSRVQ